MIKIVLELILFLLLTIIKFLFVPYAMLETGHYNLIEIIFIHSSGAAFGVYLFYHFGELIFGIWNSWRRKKNKSTKSKRGIIKIKNKYGLRGLLLVSGLISVPVTALIAARYFKSENTVAYLVMGFFFWSVALTFISFGIYNLIH